MTEHQPGRGSGEDMVDESGRNPTERRIDRERDNDRPADAPWPGDGDRTGGQSGVSSDEPVESGALEHEQ